MASWTTEGAQVRGSYYGILEDAETARVARGEAWDAWRDTERAHTAAQAVADWRRAEQAAERAARAADRAGEAAWTLAQLAPEAAAEAWRGEDLRARFADEIGTAAYNAQHHASEAREAAQDASEAAQAAGRAAERATRAGRLALC